LEPDTELNHSSTGFITVGKIMKPRGIQGEAFLLPLTDFPQRFDDLDSVRVEAPDGTYSVLNVAYVHAYGSRLAIKFQDIDTPEHVGRLREHFILVARDAVYPLPDNSFYVFELEGLPVETASGAMVGHVVEVLSYPANDVYVVDRNGEDVLIPAVREIVHVDQKAGKIVVQEIEGLL
jgi:16S rRNA processing protein RimM